MLRLAEKAALDMTSKKSTAVSAVKSQHTIAATNSTYDKLTITSVPSADAGAEEADRKALTQELKQFIESFPKGTSYGYREAMKEGWTVSHEPSKASTKRFRGWQNDTGLNMLACWRTADPTQEVTTEFWYQEPTADE
jgi:hypothetical protein